MLAAVITLVLLPSVMSASISTPMAISMCEWNGHHFPPGAQYKPNDCTFCQCDNGRAACAIADCFFTPCVDSVHKPGQCCNACPNGNNCYAKGKIIPAGKEVPIDDFTFCTCPSPWARPQEAKCISRPQTVPVRFSTIH
ncbi:hypothetical protein SNE40_000699 [Patella caerulea]|uniref:VWFC domain-containing protein n=1 Tax=Patella caerulea TaxID=87958 RepID=A0AAN8KLX1_PATCE